MTDAHVGDLTIHGSEGIAFAERSGPDNHWLEIRLAGGLGVEVSAFYGYGLDHDSVVAAMKKFLKENGEASEQGR